MNETIALLGTRRSVAPLAMSGEGPDADQLERILTLGTRVPDHGKLAPWRIILFQGEGRTAAGSVFATEWALQNPGAEANRLDLERRRFLGAPLVVGVVSSAAPHAKIPEWEQVLSAGAVCMNLVVAANALGFATAWLTEWYAYDRAVLTALGLKPHEKIAGFIHIGQAASRPEDRPRPALGDVVTRFTGRTQGSPARVL